MTTPEFCLQLLGESPLGETLHPRPASVLIFSASTRDFPMRFGTLTPDEHEAQRARIAAITSAHLIVAQAQLIRRSM
jgi:hypothetical protein